jgi:hypothetical protein
MMGATKDAKADGLKYTPRKTVSIGSKSDDPEDRARALAEHSTGGPFAALRVIRASEKSAGYEADLDLPACWRHCAHKVRPPTREISNMPRLC